jgi:hypothetical protein
MAIGLVAAPVAGDDGLVEADVGDDDDTLPLEDPQAASRSAADAASATPPPPKRIVRVVRVVRVPGRVVDIMFLIAISSSS